MENCQDYLKAQKSTRLFFSPTEVWCLPAPSVIKPEEGEFVVDSGASMRRLCRKDLNSSELETVRVSESPTMVVTANGEVQTHEQATVHDRELDLFVTLMLLEDTPAVLSLGKLCEDHGYSHELTTDQKPQPIKSGRRIKCTRRTTYQSLSLVYRLVLPAQVHVHLQHHYGRIL